MNALTAAAFFALTATAAVDADSIETLLKEKGQTLPGLFKVNVPQAELRVALDGFLLTPAMGLTSWLSFEPKDGQTAVQAELVLLEDEVAPAQKLALASGFSVMGIYHRFTREKPRLFFMSLRASGKQEDLTEKGRGLLDFVRQGRSARGLQPGPTRLDSGLEAAALERILKIRPRLVEGVLRFSLPEGGWAAFQGTMEKAAVAGEMRVGSETLKALAKGGLEIAALREGSTACFWGTGAAEGLARALAAAK